MRTTSENFYPERSDTCETDQHRAGVTVLSKGENQPDYRHKRERLKQVKHCVFVATENSKAERRAYSREYREAAWGCDSRDQGACLDLIQYVPHALKIVCAGSASNLCVWP